ncbi:MAG: hypothetical protein JO065_13910 [Acidobacteria bacterium]|nr:hypothetical protein [Acidobacteriota bacterium]MBV9437669.1 hypothetical protein [Acidobacteriota bacterium]
MSPQQYKDFVQKLDSEIPKWEVEIRHLSDLEASLDSEKRKQVIGLEVMASAILDQIKSDIASEREYASLAIEITMLDKLSSASNQLAQAQIGVEDSHDQQPISALRSLQEDISSYSFALHDHVLNRAYDLENELDCSSAKDSKRVK